MAATTPAEVYELFAAALNDGDIEAMMALYEPDIVLVTEPGQTVNGIDRARQTLEGFIALNGTITMAPPQIVQGPDLAFLASQWSFEGTGPDGQPVTLGGVSADVVRLGADGAWRFALDNPYGDALLKAD
jgi:uncharacterized protein (TIGR02246 family)